MVEVLKDKIKSKRAVVCIVGVGYVGLPNAVLFADKGFNVIAADVSERIVELTNKGVSHINDPVLNKSVPRVFATGRLKAMRDVTAAAKQSDVIIISVPTPAEKGEPDLSFVEKACTSVAKGLKRGSLVIVESTVYPGACRTFVKPLLEKESGLECGKDFFLAHCPERLNPGDNEHNVMVTPRVVGGVDEKSGDAAKALYESVVDARIVLVSNADTAELSKLVENTQRDVNIAYINEIAVVCEKTGIDVKEIIEACSSKWNFYRTKPSAGVGGHCLPNNPYYILKASQAKGFYPTLIMTARKLNDSMPLHTADLIENALKESGKDIGKSTVAIMGVAYKENVDDVRQAPSRVIIPELLKRGAKVEICDPYVNEANMAKVHSSVTTAEKALGADCVVFLVAHDEFKKIAPSQVKAKAVVDAAFLFDKNDFAGKAYKRVGMDKGLE
ncbi:nucleotide sugar dehydrogenase [Candidatus Micrarchaeota archaeon]|nr:nucleotide sugar dehydrogenase [Candidatus Micrarchaeota archaeon]